MVFLKKSRWSCLFLLLLGLVPMAISAPFPIEKPDSALQAYINRVLQSHPNLEAMQAMAAAQSYRAAMSRSWMNPDLRIGLMNQPDNFDLWSDPMTMIQVGVMQRVPFPGKLRAAGAAADAGTKRSELTTERERSVMAGMAAMAYYDLAGAMAVRDWTQRGAETARQMTDAATVMVSSGMGSLSDINQGRLGEEEWERRLIASRGEIDRKQAVFDYFENQPSTAGNFSPIIPSNLPSVPAVEVMLADEVIAATPQVKLALAEVESARRSEAAARLDYYPDVDLMLAYGLRGDLKSAGGVDPMTGVATPAGRINQDNMISLEATFPIPLFHKGNQSAKIQEMRQMRIAAEAAAKDAKLIQVREIRELHSRLTEELASLQVLTERIIPETESAYQNTSADYRSGKTPFMTLSQVRMKWVMAQMEAAMTKAEVWGRYYQLMAALGWMQIETGEK